MKRDRPTASTEVISYCHYWKTVGEHLQGYKRLFACGGNHFAPSKKSAAGFFEMIVPPSQTRTHTERFNKSTLVFLIATQVFTWHVSVWVCQTFFFSLRYHLARLSRNRQSRIWGGTTMGIVDCLSKKEVGACGFSGAGVTWCQFMVTDSPWLMLPVNGANANVTMHHLTSLVSTMRISTAQHGVRRSIDCR